MIHALSNVHPDATIGEGVQIGAFSSVAADVVIGKGTVLHPNVVIMDGARIGEGCEIFPGAVISAVPQDLKFGNEYTTTEIGNNTTIRECVTIHRGTTDKMKTVVGNNCLLMGYVHVAHDCIIGNNCVLANYTGLSGHNIIGDYVILEGKVGSQQFVEIGAHAFVAGASLIRKNIPPFIKVAREPLTFAGVNTIGLRRRGFTDAQVQQIENAYRIIFVQNQNISKGLAQVEAELELTPEVQFILDFIRRSDKGVIKGPL